MPSLSEAQRNFVATINDGPDALDATLFSGSPERIILGLKAHANTISHARLVALEQSFPLTRVEVGEVLFNALSREYVETAEAKACDLAHIGRHFAKFFSHSLPSSSEEGHNAAICDLAKIEWAWLESYHAADTSSLSLETIGALAETLLSVRRPKSGFSPSTTVHSKPHKNVGSPSPSVTFSRLPANKGKIPTPSGRS